MLNMLFLVSPLQFFNAVLEKVQSSCRLHIAHIEVYVKFSHRRVSIANLSRNQVPCHFRCDIKLESRGQATCASVFKQVSIVS